MMVIVHVLFLVEPGSLPRLLFPTMKLLFSGLVTCLEIWRPPAVGMHPLKGGTHNKSIEDFGRFPLIMVEDDG